MVCGVELLVANCECASVYILLGLFRFGLVDIGFELGSRASDVHGSLGHRRFRVCRGAELYDGLRRLVIPSCRKQDLALQHPKGYASLGKRTWIWGTLGGVLSS